MKYFICIDIKYGTNGTVPLKKGLIYKQLNEIEEHSYVEVINNLGISDFYFKRRFIEVSPLLKFAVEKYGK